MELRLTNRKVVVAASRSGIGENEDDPGAAARPGIVFPLADLDGAEWLCNIRSGRNPSLRQLSNLILSNCLTS